MNKMTKNDNFVKEKEWCLVWHKLKQTDCIQFYKMDNQFQNVNTNTTLSSVWTDKSRRINPTQSNPIQHKILCFTGLLSTRYKPTHVTALIRTDLWDKHQDETGYHVVDQV